MVQWLLLFIKVNSRMIQWLLLFLKANSRMVQWLQLFLKPNSRMPCFSTWAAAFSKTNSKMLFFFEKWSTAFYCGRKSFWLFWHRLGPSCFHQNLVGQIMHWSFLTSWRSSHSCMCVAWLSAIRQELIKLMPELILLMASNLGIQLSTAYMNILAGALYM